MTRREAREQAFIVLFEKIFDNKTVSVNASAEVPFPQNKEELP